MRYGFSLLHSIILVLFGLMIFACAGFAVFDAAVLLQARSWPTVAARVDYCSMVRRYSKQDSWWEVSATFSYGSGFARHHDETWKPTDSPTYGRSPEPVVSDSEQNALNKRFCDQAQASGLRVSSAHPFLARRSGAVETGEWKANLWLGLFFLVAGTLLSAVGVGLFPGKLRPFLMTSKRKKIAETPSAQDHEPYSVSQAQ